jgi:DNA (cytosine-5)-methyltransferase 1
MTKNPLYGNYTLVSLFAGAGGLDLGFQYAGIKAIWANDIDRDACTTHEMWSDAQVICDDISKVNLNLVPNATIIAGGFPCQGFSLAGPRLIDDERNALYKYFVKLVELKQPYAFVAENVKGILTLGKGKIIEAIIYDFSIKGYDVFPYLVNAADYGVPQDRWRVFLVGFRKDLNVSNVLFPQKSSQRVTLSEVIKDFPVPSSCDFLEGSYSSRYMSRNRRRSWNEVSFTIPAMAKQIPLHPSSPEMKKIDQDLWEFGKGDTRRFSWQEAAAIQTFPIDFEFCGSLVSKYKQIGNAVPVKLALVVGNLIKSVLDEKLGGN